MRRVAKIIGSLLIYSFISYSKSECVLSETTVSGTFARGNPQCAGELIFEDHFEKFDLEKWTHENTLSGGGNWEFQWYTNNRSNSYVQNGNLHIRPTLLTDVNDDKFLYSGTLDVNGGAAGKCTDASFYGCIRTGTPTNYLNSIKSAKIKTMDSFSFRYGKVEIRAKMPSGDWLWPAIWMMPRFNSYGTWPASGEIDIVESRGNTKLTNKNGDNIGAELAGSTLHWAPFPQANQWFRTHFDKRDASGYNNDFHKYELEWSSSNISFSIDGKLLGVIAPPEEGFWKFGEFNASLIENPWAAGSKMAPFDQKFYLIINLAVGGTNHFFGDQDNNPGGKPWKNSSPTAYKDFWKGRDQWLPTWDLTNDDTHLIVDYVKVYSV